jgi:hypothetical protein
MNDQKRAYSYDDLFPERWLHAPDLDGKTVTLTITAAYAEFIENPKKHKKDDPGELCGVLSFKGTKREYVLSKQNAWILKALWGKDPGAYVGKRIALSPVPDSSGFTEHGTRILFTGSPDIEHDLSLNLPGGKHVTFKRTAVGAKTVMEASVDPVTGEVDEAPPTDDAEPVSSASDAADDSDSDDELFAPEMAESDDDDIDAALASVQPIRAEKATQPQLAAIQKLIKQTGIYEAELAGVLDSYGATTVKELTKQNAEYVLAALKERAS